MEKLFLTVLGMSGTASVVILVLLLARLALRKAPKAFSYALWAVALFRLLCPFSIESAFSLAPKIQVQSRGDWSDYPMVVVDMSSREVTITVDDAPAAFPETPGSGAPAASGAPALTQPGAPVMAANAALGRWSVAGVVWLAGIGLLTGYSLLSLLKLRRRLAGSVPLAGEKNVRLADHIPSPFVLGLVRPNIYLPSDLPECERDYILLHERTHIRRFDHVTRALAWLALTVHWFNPLVWLSFYLAGKDMEMSCDEAVLRKMGREIRADYSSSLLRLSAGGKLPAGPLAFGGGSLRSRIKNVLGYKKPALWAVGLALIAVVCAGAVLATDFGGQWEPFDAGLEGLSADLAFSLGKESTTVRIEGTVDGIELDHTMWFSPAWYEPYDDTKYPLGRLMFEMPLCGGEVTCELDACWTDESRTAVMVTATPRATFSSYAPSGNLFITVDLSKGKLLKLDGYIPKMAAGSPERVPTQAEAVRAARVAALLLEAVEKFYESPAAPEPSDTPPPAPSANLASFVGLPWEVPEAEAAPSYEDYFAQVIDYHFPDFTDPYAYSSWKFQYGYDFDQSYTLVYKDPDLYFSKHYFEYFHGERPDLWLWKIAEIPNLKIFYADQAWIYAVAGGRELIRMDYFGRIETLFTDEAGLIQIYGLSDGKVLYFWAGLPEGGAAIYRLYIPEGRADALYQITREELASYYYKPPAGYGEVSPYSTVPGYQLSQINAISNFEFVWKTPNPEFWALYDSIALQAEDYPQYFSWGLNDNEIRYYIGVDYGVWEYTEHYYNAFTGEYREHYSRSSIGPLPLWWKE